MMPFGRDRKRTGRGPFRATPYWIIVNELAWVTVAAAAAGLVAGRYVVVLAAWLSEADPARADPVRWRPPRRCPHPGGTVLRAADLVPLTGWRGLRGRC